MKTLIDFVKRSEIFIFPLKLNRVKFYGCRILGQVRFLRRSKIIIAVLYGALNHIRELYSFGQPDRRIELNSVTNKRSIEDWESWARVELK